MLLTLGDHAKKKEFTLLDFVVLIKWLSLKFHTFTYKKKNDPDPLFTEINLQEWNTYLPKETSGTWTWNNKAWGYS